MVYLLDPNTGTGMSVDHQYLAQSIAERYPNIRLAQIPLSNRDSNEEYPFALLDATTREVVKPLRADQCTISFIYQWLYEHDTQARGVAHVYDNYMKQKAEISKAKKNKAMETFHENVDIVHTMANSRLHTFKHGNRKIG